MLTGNNVRAYRAADNLKDSELSNAEYVCVIMNIRYWHTKKRKRFKTEVLDWSSPLRVIEE